MKPASKDLLDREVADFNQWALIERTSWRQTIRRITRSYATNGFHFEEPLDAERSIPTTRFPNHPGEGVGIVPTTYNDLPAWTIHRWFQSKRNARQLAAIEQFVVGSDREETGFSTVASNRLLRFTYDQEGAKYTGTAVLRAAYQPWKLKMAFLSYDAVKHERTGLGIPSLTLDEEAEKKDIDAAEEILAEMRVNEKGFLILPSGYKFEWVGASESDSSNLDLAIARCNIDIAYNVAAAFMLLSLVPGSTGSNAVGGTQQGAYHLTIDAHGAFIMDAFNIGQDGWSPIERTTRLNYGPDVGVPSLIVRNLPTRDWLKVAASVYKGVAAGVITADDPLEAQLRDSHDLGPHDPETAREKPVSLGSQPKRNPGDGEGDESDNPDPFEGDDGGDPTDE